MKETDGEGEREREGETCDTKRIGLQYWGVEGIDGGDERPVDEPRNWVYRHKTYNSTEAKRHCTSAVLDDAAMEEGP